MEIRGVDSVVACEKIKLATDQRFSCYDRQEESISLGNYLGMYYGYEYKSLEELRKAMEEYITYYNIERMGS